MNRNQQTFRLMLAAGAVGALTHLASAQVSFFGINSPDNGYDDTEVTCVAFDGSACGAAINRPGVQGIATWSNGQSSELPLPDEADYAAVRHIARDGDPHKLISIGGVRQNGQLAAGYWESYDGVSDGFRMLTNSRGGPSEAYGASANGATIVGSRYEDLYGDGIMRSRAVQWRAFGDAEDLPLPGGYDISQAKTSSRDGKVVAGYVGRGEAGADALLATSAAIWKGGLVTLVDSDPDDGIDSVMNAVSGDGSVGILRAAITRPGVQVAGGYDIELATTFPLHNADSDGDGVEDHDSDALAVNFDGSLIGGWVALGGDPVATIWERGLDGSYAEYTAAEYLSSRGVIGMDGWQLGGVSGISDDGTMIAGWGINPIGQSDGWVAMVPAPGPLALLGIGGVLAARRRR